MNRFFILSNNFVSRKRLLAEHGLSILIEIEGKKIIFDTGQSDVYIHNSKVMNLNLNDADFIVLSHGHYDHTGGLKYFDFNNSKAHLVIHPDALKEKYYVGKNEQRYIGMPCSLSEIGIPEERIIYVKKYYSITENILVCGEIPRTTDFEEIPVTFKIKNDGEFVNDNFADEQMLIINTERGLVIFLGCSHPGVINCLKYAVELIPNRKILAVIGGMHLNNVSSYRLNKTIQYFEEMKVEKVFPMHCTGFNSIIEMKKAMGDKCVLCEVGDEVLII